MSDALKAREALEAVKTAMARYDLALTRREHGDIAAGRCIADVRTALSALDQPSGVRVKPLKWNPFRAETPFGYYHIDDQTDRSVEERHGRDPFLLSGSRIDLSRHPSLAAARAAAQSDYERRILSALDLSAIGAEGWKLVPAEPTPEMLAAFWRQKNVGTQTIGPIDTSTMDCSDYAAYRAMIAAAPSPPEPRL